MEKYSNWRDPATGVAPFLVPLPPSTDSLPPIVQFIALPLAWSLGAIRTGLVLLCLLLQAVLVEGLLAVCLVIPPLHVLLSRALTAILARVVLFLLGFVWIQVETVSLRRTARSPPALPFAPEQGDVLIANSSSYIDVLYLAFRYNPTFLLPVSSTGSSSPAKITSWRRVGLLSALLSSGALPERSERGESFAEAVRKARGPVVVFPECTTSNNRAILRFAELLAPATGTKATALKTFILSFKYPLPTRLTPSSTYPIPSSLLSHIFSLTTSPSPLSLTIRRLHPSESPKLSTSLKKEEWEAVAESLAATGRWKRCNGLGWERKEGFLEFRKKRA
ncbi:hypothetical protein BCR35DRAFT_333910 [Leucosporidium creatinivorum]|uniref:Phospholipid/glycerol acyltransferase domain-containing protein n=1 Tax=Leucosporidium creatinivorum TaxID=106004 RepID=A0A1Y2EMF2_9BASI|nr:hypothetical protein BCR35DRAFT_333910 [Leucosporidium creatinivorum]